jgi:hypothetical protein
MKRHENNHRGPDHFVESSALKELRKNDKTPSYLSKESPG